MNSTKRTKALRLGFATFVGCLLVGGQILAAEMMHKSGPFKGVKANSGSVSHSQDGNKHVLTLSDNFKMPDAPDVHWRVIDSKGTIYDLQRLAIKGDKINRKIILPVYIADVAKVQMWCAFAEVNLGEASFEKPIMLSSR
jgi:hypothetical protein